MTDHLLTPDEADALAAPFKALLPTRNGVRTLEQYRRVEATLTRALTDTPRRPPLQPGYVPPVAPRPTTTKTRRRRDDE